MGSVWVIVPLSRSACSNVVDHSLFSHVRGAFLVLACGEAVDYDQYHYFHSIFFQRQVLHHYVFKWSVPILLLPVDVECMLIVVKLVPVDQMLMPDVEVVMLTVAMMMPVGDKLMLVDAVWVSIVRKLLPVCKKMMLVGDKMIPVDGKMIWADRKLMLVGEMFLLDDKCMLAVVEKLFPIDKMLMLFLELKKKFF